MDHNSFDCAIAGGGLAGLTLAVQLADAGHSVILFEKEKYPFHKVCGEYISMESFDFLERIGVPLSELNLPFISRVRISSPNGNTASRKLDLGGFGISRYRLDSTLAELARQKGAIILEDSKVIDITFENDCFLVKTDNKTYRAKVACAAYGKRSALENKLERKNFRSKKNYIAVKYHIKLDFPADVIELHNFQSGYCGISKIDAGKYCLCYLTNSKNLRDNNNDIKLMEQNVLMKNPFLKKYFTEAEFLYDKPLTISQVKFNNKSALEKGIIMLGDAAGNIAPLCGNGMSMAMHSSFIAGGLINRFLKQEIPRTEMENSYQKFWYNTFYGRIRLGKYIQYFFGRARVTNFTLKLLNRFPSLADRLISLTHGRKF